MRIRLAAHFSLYIHVARVLLSTVSSSLLGACILFHEDAIYYYVSRESAVLEHAHCDDPVAAMGFIRSKKDNFKAKF